MSWTFVKERPPLPEGSGGGPVTVDDCAMFVGSFAGGGFATFCAADRKNALRVELSAQRAVLRSSWKRLTNWSYYDAREPVAAPDSAV